MLQKRTKPRLRVTGGYWLCSLPGSGFTGVGMTPASSYDVWRAQAYALRLAANAHFGKFAYIA